MKLIILLTVIGASSIADVYSSPQVWPFPLDDSFGRIVNGSVASKNQFPYQVLIAIGTTLNSSLSTFCGGSLISVRWVLTAGHCAKGKTTFACGFGVTSLYSIPLILYSYNAKVHPGYDPNRLVNDLALIQLPIAVPLGPSIGVIRLPRRSQVNTKFVNAKARISGWGKVSDNSTSLSLTLLWTDLRIISNIQCSNSYGGNVIKSSMVCGVGWLNIHSNACNGDSGGPLTVNETGTNTIIGLVSFGIRNGCSSGEPTVYTRITSYLDWILLKTKILPR